MSINIDLDRELYQLYLLRSLNIDEYDLINSTAYISQTNLKEHIIVPSHILHKENDISLNKKLNDIISKIKKFQNNTNYNSKVNIYKKNNIVKLTYKKNNVKILTKIYNKIRKDILQEYRDKVDDNTFNKLVFVLVKRYMILIMGEMLLNALLAFLIILPQNFVAYFGIMNIYLVV
jgi:hypothetical protein